MGKDKDHSLQMVQDPGKNEKHYIKCFQKAGLRCQMGWFPKVQADIIGK
jgi:hypothetical protein